jgi:hypothetical protein
MNEKENQISDCSLGFVLSSHASYCHPQIPHYLQPIWPVFLNLFLKSDRRCYTRPLLDMLLVVSIFSSYSSIDALH